jgi:hypothetical protein
MSEEKKGQRMAGTALQVAARLMETPGSGALLYRMATKQLGIEALSHVDIPADVPPYRPIHLGGRPARPIVLRPEELTADADAGRGEPS